MRPFAFHAHPLRPIAFTTALLAWMVALAPTPQPSRVDLPTRPSEAAPAIEPLPFANPPTEDAPTRGSDVIVEDYPVRTAALRAWHANDQVEVPDADGRLVELHVERDSTAGGRRHLTLSHDGLVSTFTQSGDRYFGTLATADGVYALDGDERSARLTRHALLDQRMNPHATDYRARPTP